MSAAVSALIGLTSLKDVCRPYGARSFCSRTQDSVLRTPSSPTIGRPERDSARCSLKSTAYRPRADTGSSDEIKAHLCDALH